MRRMVGTITGTFAFTWGCILLLYLLPWLLLRHPRHQGVDYLLGVGQEALKPQPLGVAGVSLLLVLAGIALGLKGEFPAPSETHLGRRRLLLLFWSLALGGTGAVFLLLLGITLLNLRWG